MITLQISEQDFDVSRHYQELIKGNSSAGALLIFVGKVRDLSQNGDIAGMYLEHYPGMTENALKRILHEAENRWELNSVTVIHRVGLLKVDEQIVFVGVSSHHREDTFEAVQFIMDYLKNDVPIWKKELTQSGEQKWAKYNPKEQQAKARWREHQKL